jgi:hypothetical protein
MEFAEVKFPLILWLPQANYKLEKQNDFDVFHYFSE